MHGAYCFLIEIDPTDSLENQGIEAIDSFNSLFSSRLDENNWYEPMALVTQNGEVLNLVEKGDYRGREEFASTTFANIPVDQVWNASHKLALECVAVEMRLFASSPYSFAEKQGNKKIESMSYDEINNAIAVEIPQALSNMYKASVNDLKMAFTKESFPGEGAYLRNQLATQLEAYSDSEIKPFTQKYLTPYCYRCFDLRDENNGEVFNENVVMLWVDIHT